MGTSIFLVLLVIGSIVDEEPTPQVSSSRLDTTTSQKLTTTTTTTTSTSTSVASATTTAPPEDDSAAAPLRGIGQTRAAWDRSHRKAPGFTTGSAYLPIIGGRQPTYAAVFGDERILVYSLYMEPGTSLAMAERRVGLELPIDAIAEQRTDGGDCYLQYWTSERLAEATGGQKLAVAYSKEDLTVPREQRYVVADLILVEQNDDTGC